VSVADKKLVGENYETPDLRAKVTGRSKYAEDFRAEGMLFATLVPTPYSHARIVSIDASEALAMPGVVGARGIGEPPVAAGCCAVLNAISAALGDEVFVGAPVLLDHIVNALETGKPGQERLTANV
jgi:xanthine dehydrogenase molybdenum-binding subunit